MTPRWPPSAICPRWSPPPSSTGLPGIPPPSIWRPAGFRDITRIALSDPGWWTDVLVENRAALGSLLRGLGEDLQDLGRPDRVGGSGRRSAPRCWRPGLPADP